MTGAPQFSRRTVLVVATTGAVAVLTGCTAFSDDQADAVTAAQVDQLAGQVAVQRALVAAYAAAFAAAPQLAAQAGALAQQCSDQLSRLEAAAPGASGRTPPAAAAPAGDPRAALRSAVAATADSHAAACAAFSGARAALLGSVAAGLRGQYQQLT